MRPITKHEILPFEQWERVRRVLRPLFINEKERRRFAVGSHITLLFENSQTVWYQIEEMLRAEKIWEPEAVRHEIDTYNELLPARGELSATILIEYPDQIERDAALRGLVGLQQHFWLNAGDHRIPAKFDENEMNAEQISAVQFVHFPLEATDAENLVQLAGMGRLAVVVDHPRLTAEAPIGVPLARALADDLGGDSSPA
jgi:Protein of unknown function (DUF3501)